MIIRLLTIGNKMPSWVEAGFQDYAKRLPSSCQLELIEIAPIKRTKNSDVSQCMAEEGKKMLAIIKPHHHIIALTIQGKQWNSEQLAMQLENWQQERRNIDLLVGGADGLAEICLKKAETHWSLSALTLPHQLVRIVIAEQIYRAASILQKHPYHR